MIGIHCSFRFKTTECKTLGAVLKKMNTDTKQLFGNLLETNAMRKKRLKLTNKSLDDKKGKESNNQLKSKIIVPTEGKS